MWRTQAREVMDAMQKDADFSQVQLLKVDGGASNNNLLMQMQADALQVTPLLLSIRYNTCASNQCIAYSLLLICCCVSGRLIMQ